MVNFTFMDRVWGNMMGTGSFPLIIMHVYHDHLRSTIVNHGQPLRTPVPFFTRQHSNTMCIEFRGLMGVCWFPTLMRLWYPLCGGFHASPVRSGHRERERAWHWACWSWRVGIDNSLGRERVVAIVYKATENHLTWFFWKSTELEWTKWLSWPFSMAMLNYQSGFTYKHRDFRQALDDTGR